MSETLRAHLGPSTMTPMLEKTLPTTKAEAEVLPTLALTDSFSRRLDDMLSMPFSPHIINYELPRGFIVSKFIMYDGTGEPFDHIMHFRQLMTLDMGNDALICKVFPPSLHCLTLSWFHRLSPNSVNMFRDISKAFVG